MTLWTAILRSCRLRCPECGRGKFARTWNSTHDECSHCGLDFRVDWGFYLGSIYVSYLATGLIVTSTCVPIVIQQHVPWLILTPVAVVFCIVFPYWFWRYARSIWFGINHYLDQGRWMKQKVQSECVHQDGAAATLKTDSQFQFVCPHCHMLDYFDEKSAKTWTNCIRCGEAVLSLPIYDTNTDQSDSNVGTGSAAGQCI